jgi:integrase
MGEQIPLLLMLFMPMICIALMLLRVGIDGTLGAIGTGGILMTLRELLLAYESVCVWTIGTKRTYEYVVRIIEAEFDGRSPDLDELTVEWFAKYRGKCLERLSPFTFNSRRRHLISLVKYAQQRDWVAKNTFSLVRPAPTPNRRPKAIPKAVLACYVRHIENSQRADVKGRWIETFRPSWFWITVVRTLYFTGMRLRQLVGLQWADVDLEVKTIRLRSATSKTRREWVIPIAEQLLPVLQDLYVRTVQARGTRLINHEQVFCLPLFWTGRRMKNPEMTGEHVGRFFCRLYKSLPQDAVRISAHRMRHTTATEMMRVKNTNIRAVQEMLGHTSVHTTMQYIHPDIEDMRIAVSSL